MYDFETALSHIKRGDVWRRAAWPKSEASIGAWRPRDDGPWGIYMASFPDDGDEWVFSEEWHATSADLLATDWSEDVG